MTISTVNYRKTIFKHPDWSKILGLLTYETLHILHNEIKSNALAVYSNLGDGQHGYLSLVFRPTAYSLLTNTPFETTKPVVLPLTMQQPNQDSFNSTSPYQNFQTNIYEHTVSFHTKAHLATINIPSIMIPQPFATITVEAHMIAPDKGGRQT